MGLQATIAHLQAQINQIRAMIRPTEDSLGGGISAFERNNNGSEDSLRILLGTITDICPSLNSYRVDVPFSSRKVCTPLSLTGSCMNLIPGYSPGDLVVVAGSRKSNVGYILGHIPEHTMYGASDLRPFISQSERFKPGPFDKGFFNLVKGKNHESPEWTVGSPLKREDCSEFYIGSGAGPQLFMDPFMATIHQNDATGIWVFRDDSMIRIAGINYQLISSGSYDERFNDNGECNEFSGHCLHSWEQYGYYRKPPKDITERIKDWDLQNKQVTFRELLERECKPYYRVMELGGWLGQGKQSFVIGPPNKINTESYEVWDEYEQKKIGFTNDLPARYGKKYKEKQQNGLSRIIQGMDGFVGVESLKGISFVKRSRMPALQQLEMSNDTYFETDYDYDHDGWDKLRGEPQITDTTHALMQSLLGIDDYRAYTFNYKTYKAVSRHTDKWYVPNESRLVLKPDYKLENNLHKLLSRSTLAQPKPYTIRLEKHKHKYYAVEAGIHLLPDGGVVIHDGYGSELRMTGGQITLSAPGGVWIRSGKEINLWGKDVNLRSRNCMDMSTSEGSVRIKAEKNLELLGGNEGGESGVVIESRGTGDIDFSQLGESIKTGGIIMRAPYGAVTTHAGTVYTSAPLGGIMLDTQYQNIYTVSNIKTDYVLNKHTLTFGDPRFNNIMAVQESTAWRTTIPGQIHGNMGAYFQQQLLVDMGIFSGQGVYAKSAVVDRHLSPISGELEKWFDNTINDSRTLLTVDLPTDQNEFLVQTIQPNFFYDHKPGNEVVFEQAGFSFRTTEDLNLKNFYVYEDRWQTICTTVGDYWDESPVRTYNGTGMYPYPGDKYFKDESCLISQKRRFIHKRGYAKSRKPQNYKKGYHKPKRHPLKKFRTL